jgi:hypothetical protein
MTWFQHKLLLVPSVFAPVEMLLLGGR